MAENLFKDDQEHLDEARHFLVDKKYVLLSALKNQFYESLPLFKNKLYERVKNENMFSGNPEKTRITWKVKFIFNLRKDACL